MTSDAEIVVAIRGDTNGGRVVKRTLDDIASSGDKTTTAMQRAERQMQSLDRAAGMLKNVMVGLVGSFGISQILKAADSYQVLMARVQGVTKATGDYASVSRELFEISQRTGSALEGNVQLFQRLSIGAKELGKSNTEILTLAETVNKLGLLGGASTAALAAGTMQFSQAMAGGILRAEEFNSIMENIPEVGAAIAKGMSLTVGQLRQAVISGKVLANDVFSSLSGQAAEIASRFVEMPLSLGRAAQMLKNSFQQYLGEIDASLGVTRGLAEAVALLANNMDDLAKALVLLATTGLAVVIGKLSLSTAAWVAETIATRASAVAALEAAKAQQTASLMTLTAVRSNTALTASHISNATAARAYTAATLQLGSAQTALAATTLTLSGVGASALAMFGGWPGVILAAVAAIVIFRKEIAEALDGIAEKFFGVTDITNKYADATKLVFAGVASVIGGTFAGLMNAFDGLLAGLNVKIYKFSESLNRLPGVNIDNSDLLKAISEPGYFEKSQRSFAENFKLGGDKVDSEIEGLLSSGMTPKAGKGTSPLVEEAKAFTGSIGDSTEAAKKLKDAQRDLASLVKATATDQEKYNATVKELEGLRGYAKTAEEITAIERGIKAAGDELEKVRIQAERNGPVAKAFESLASEIDDGFKDAFKGAFTESDGGFKKLIAGWKSTFKDFLAELAYQALARPIIVSMVTSVGGVMGVSSGAQASILGTGTGTGGFGLSNLSSMMSNGWSAISGGLNAPIFGAGSMIGSGINSIGSALGLSNANFIGPMMPGAGNLASAFTPAAGLAGFGGNMLGNLIFGGDRGIGASIGGALGGIGGTAIGASMGTILGMAGGPVGALAGAFLSNALGGLFGGGGVPRQTLGGSLVTGDDGKFKINTVSTKGGDISQASDWLNQIGGILDAAMQLTGGTINGVLGSIQTNVGKKDTGTFYNKTRLSSSAGDTDAVIRYLLGTEGRVQGGNEDIMGVMKRSIQSGSGSEQLISDLLFAQSIFGETQKPAETAAKAIEEINAQFVIMYERANLLGMPIDKVTEALEKQKAASIGLVNAMQAGFQSMEAMKATFDSWMNGQAMSAVSSLSPMDKLKLAQDQFGGLLEKAQGGDYSVTQELLASAQQLLAVGQGVYASSISFANLEGFVRSSIGQIAKELNIPGYATGTGSASAGLAWVGERGPELVRFRGGEQVHTNAESNAMAGRSTAQMEARITENSENVAAMRKELREMTRQLSRVANEMKVVSK